MATSSTFLWGGGEICEHCLQVYFYEAEYRCEACDGPVCPDCVVAVRETRLVLCPGCCQEAGGREDAAPRARAS